MGNHRESLFLIVFMSLFQFLFSVGRRNRGQYEQQEGKGKAIPGCRITICEGMEMSDLLQQTEGLSMWISKVDPRMNGCRDTVGRETQSLG